MKILELWSRLPVEKRALILQILRYAVVGFGITLVQSAVYLLLASRAHLHEQFANFMGYLVAVLLGFFLHNKVTFRDAARDEGRKAQATRGARFVFVSLISLALNALWVWLCVTWQHWPEWTPVPGFLFITPAVIFLLNRKWVFR
jgi:putative flippase GtrA